MSKPIDELTYAEQSNYHSRIGELFLLLNSPEHEIQCKTLAMTDWEEIRVGDAVALLSLLATDASSEVRQLVALQLVSLADSLDDPRILQVLVTLASDSEAEVRSEIERSTKIASELSLTPDDQSEKSLADRFVDWQQVGDTTIFSLRSPDISIAKRLQAILAGFMAREMTHPSNEKNVQALPNQSPGKVKENLRLPDAILDEDQPNFFELPRQGAVREVVNVQKVKLRLPELLLDD